MKFILITFAVVLCANIQVSQANSMFDFNNLFGGFGGFFKKGPTVSDNTDNTDDSHSSFGSTFPSVKRACSADAHVCAQTGGQLNMASAQTDSDDYYIIEQKGPRALSVFNKNTGEYEEDVTPTPNPLKPGSEALNCRDVTKGSYKLKAYADDDLPILTYYAPFATNDGLLNTKMWNFFN